MAKADTPKQESPKGVRLAPHLRAFVEHLAKQNGQDSSEVIRGLIVQELKRWEDLHRKPFEPPKDGGEEIELEK